MDMIENNARGDDGLPEPGLDDDDTWGHPKTLGLIALSLAVLCLFGVGALRGSTYTLLLSDDTENGLTQHKNLLVAGAFLSAALALVPVALAKIGLQRLVPDDGEWAGHILRAAFFLGSVAVVLDLVRALMAFVNNDPGTIQLLL